jgi:hypothetical protein
LCLGPEVCDFSRSAFVGIGHHTPNMTSSSMAIRLMALSPLLMSQMVLANAHLPGLYSYVAPSGFPTSVFSSYYPGELPH